MAIARFKKLQLIAHNTVRESLLEELQQIGGVHIVDWREGDLEEEQAVAESPLPTSQAGVALGKIEHCLKFIKPFEPSLGFMEKLAQGKPQVNLPQLKSLEAKFDLEQVYSRCQELEHQIHELHQHTQQFQAQLADLQPWVGLNVSLEELQETEVTYFYVLKLAQEHSFERFHEQLEERLNGQVVLQEVSREGDYYYLVVIVLKEGKPLLESLMVDFEVEQVKLPLQPYSPQQIIQQAQEGLARTEQELQLAD